MQTLYFDCFAGVSGDMTLGALIDLGVDFKALKAELQKLHLPGYRLGFERVSRANIAGTKFHVLLDEDHNHHHEHGKTHSHDHDHDHEHHHEHGHEHHHHDHHPTQRNLSDICTIIDNSELSPWVKDTAKDIFYRLATAEGSVHGMPPE